ncbi:hypothetical protein [Natrinema salaciae]|uniref:hypothetical protein n=1 Tax=Natrinema salaciae TaxID=1186196 RepID=UPI0015877E3F|nr:hypothetical protein [Natrinema salaciae]
MGDASDGTNDGSPPLPDCPTCGAPVAVVTASGPHTGSASPCGCSVPPDLLRRGD